MSWISNLRKSKPLKSAASILRQIPGRVGEAIGAAQDAIDNARHSGQPILPALGDAAGGFIRQEAEDDFWKRAGPKILLGAGALVAVVAIVFVTRK